MYLNGYYIRFVDSWDKQTKGEVKISTDAKYVKPKAENEIMITHKIKGIVEHEGTAQELQEMFSNPNYSIAVISECDVPEYDGVYNLDQGNIIRDGGLNTWGVELWLSNKRNSIRYSQYQEEYLQDFEYLQTETDSYTDLYDYSGSATNDGTNGFYGTTDLRFGRADWNSFVTSFDFDVRKTSMFAHYKCDDTSDSSGNNYTATNSNATFTSGKLGDAVELANGFNDYLETPFDNWIVNARTTPFTFAGWIKIDSGWNTAIKDGRTVVIGIDETGTGSLGITHGLTGDGIGYWFRDFSNNQVGQDYVHTIPDEWHHYVLTSDGTNITFYVDGQVLKDTDVTNALTGTFAASPLRLGGNRVIGGNNTEREFDGQIDDVRFYKYAITAEDVLELYNEGQGTESAMGTVMRYKFNEYEAASKTHCYEIEVRYDNRLFINKVIDSVRTKISEVPITIDTTDGNYNNMKVFFANGKLDVYIDNEHATTEFMYDIVGGQHGFYIEQDSVKVKNYSVKQFIPLTQTTATKSENYDNPSPISYINTREGVLRHHVNVDEEVQQEVYPSRVLTGQVRVWDTMDNDFNDWDREFVPMMPLYWKRVFDPAHEFQGRMYIENGIYGILFVENYCLHYVYDQPYRKGTKVDIDFTQNPNKKIWNNSYYRDIQHNNSGKANWDEYGLKFEGIATTEEADIVKNEDKIPEFDDTLFASYDTTVDVEFSPQYSKRNDFQHADGWYNVQTLYTEGGDSSNENNIAARILAGNTEADPDIDVAVNGNRQVDHGEEPVGWDEKGKVRFTKSYNFVDKGAIYVDGMIEKYGQQLAQNYMDSDGYFSIGDNIYGDGQYYGKIKNVTSRMANRGRTMHRTLYQPIIWHSFDEYDWDHSAQAFRDKGYGNNNLQVTGNYVKFIKDGRYNQALHIGNADGSYIQDDVTQVTGLNNSGFTAQMWFRVNTPFTSGSDYKHILCLVEDGGHSLIRIWGRSNGDIVLNSQDSSFNNRYITYTVAEQTANGHDVDDGKWHHLAAIWDATGTAYYFYIDGLFAGYEAGHSAIVDTFGQIRIGHEDDIDMDFDEFMFHTYTLQLHELGVIVPDTYETGQWYAKAGFTQLSNGKWIRKDKFENPSFEMEYTPFDHPHFADRVNNIQGELSSSKTQKGIAKAMGKAGVGIGLGSFYAAGGAGYYFNQGYEDQFRLDEKFTIQSHLRFEQSPQHTDSYPWYMRSTANVVTETTLYLRVDTGKVLHVYVENGSVTQTYNASFALSNDVFYDVALVWDYPNKTAKLYVDQTLYKQYSLDDIVESESGDDAYRHIAVGLGWSEGEGVVSNLVIHRDALDVSDLGIFVDTDHPLPTFYAAHALYYSENHVTWKLKSISPDLVEIDGHLDMSVHEGNHVLHTWIESGDYFFKSDWNTIPDEFASGRVGFETYFRTETQGHGFNRLSQFEPRFFLQPSGTSTVPEIHDYSIISSNKSVLTDASQEATGFAFDSINSNMFFVTDVSRDNAYTYTFYNRGDYNLPNRLDSVINTSLNAIAMVGFVPQRHVNETFWDATEMTAAGSSTSFGTYAPTAGEPNWFRMAQRSVSNASVVVLRERINNEFFDKGVYLFIARGTTTSDQWGLAVWNNTAYEYALEPVRSSSTSFDYVYGFLNIKEQNMSDEINFWGGDFASPTNTVYIDYFVIIPLTNGLNMPLDLIRQSRIKRFKTKVVE